MSCGGIELLARAGTLDLTPGAGTIDANSCGCGPGTNAHEGYKGSDRSSIPALNYSSLVKYMGQDTPLPKTAQTRSYALERIYSPVSEQLPVERIYVDKPIEFKQDVSIDMRVSEPMSTRPAVYDQSAAISELASLEDTYAKQRLLERRIGEAMMEPQNNIEPLVNMNG